MTEILEQEKDFFDDKTQIKDGGVFFEKASFYRKTHYGCSFGCDEMPRYIVAESSDPDITKGTLFCNECYLAFFN